MILCAYIVLLFFKTQNSTARKAIPLSLYKLLFTFSSGITRSRGPDGHFFGEPISGRFIYNLKKKIIIFKSIMSLRYGAWNEL